MARSHKHFAVVKLQRDNPHNKETVVAYDDRRKADSVFDTLSRRLTPQESEAGWYYQIDPVTRDVARAHRPPRPRKASTKRRDNRRR